MRITYNRKVHENIVIQRLNSIYAVCFNVGCVNKYGNKIEKWKI